MFSVEDERLLGLMERRKVDRLDEVERRAPVLPGYRGDHGSGTIAWSEHVEAWNAYAMTLGSSQSAERIAERGGFGYSELRMLLGREPSTWRPL